MVTPSKPNLPPEKCWTDSKQGENGIGSEINLENKDGGGGFGEELGNAVTPVVVSVEEDLCVNLQINETTNGCVGMSLGSGEVAD